MREYYPLVAFNLELLENVRKPCQMLFVIVLTRLHSLQEAPVARI
jgi:hypothetical protein